MEQLSLFKTMMLSIIIEAFPFILLGILVSSLIQTFVPASVFQKWLPKNMYAALVPAALIGFFFPICECAIIPLVRGFIKKGLPFHLGIVMLISAPVINPVVVLSTYYAFGDRPWIVIMRVLIILLLALVAGFVLKKWVKTSPLREDIHEHDHVIPHTQKEKWMYSFTHMSDELFSTGKFIIIGAFITATIQILVNREVFVAVADQPFLSPLLSMGFAYILSICSSSDAFIAASFKGIFSSSAILGFLTFGPVFDLKNTLVMLSYFKAKFVWWFLAGTVGFLYVVSMIVGEFL